MRLISQGVFPVCESLCFFCPSLRARSRHPVKRYKKMITEIFLTPPEEQPNDRKIGKLCEYAYKNPLRIPKITSTLERRCFKNLRLEHFLSVKVIVRIYQKLLITCKEQMPLFASSMLGIIHILLDQGHNDEIRILACEAMFDFISNQKDGTYVFNLDALVPKLCELAQQPDDLEPSRKLKLMALRTLASMIWLMGEFSHFSSEFDTVVSVSLETFGSHLESSHNFESLQEENCSLTSIPSWRKLVNEKGEITAFTDKSTDFTFWSNVCLHNMAQLAKEATTMRRVLECLFRYFDEGDLWASQHHLALTVLLNMQLTVEKSSQKTHSVLSNLIKHLDHKNVLKKPNMQIEIVKIATNLARQTKVEPSVAILGALSDMIRHLRKSIHCSLDDSTLGDEVITWNRDFRAAVEDCLTALSSLVGNADPILDVMAVMLENMTSISIMAETLLSAVYKSAQILASIPNLRYRNKGFPEALFRQLLLIMVYDDHETRVYAHRIFSVILVPSSVLPRPIHVANDSAIQRMLSRSVSVFSSSAALFNKINKPSQDDRNVGDSILGRLESTYIKSNETMDEPKQPILFLKLSSRQISILLSSIWIQSQSDLNDLQNYEALAHTYSLLLLFARAKNTFNETLMRSFQLALSLRRFALQKSKKLQPSRRRSIYTLATSMILFAAKAYNIYPLINYTNSLFSNEIIDPHFTLVDGSKLKSLASLPKYASSEDDEQAASSLLALQSTDPQCTNEILAMIMESFEAPSLIEKLSKDFLPDDLCPLGSELFKESPQQIKEVSFHQDEEVRSNKQGTDSDTRTDPSVGRVLPSVGELLDEVNDLTQSTGRRSASAHGDVPYVELAGNCEALSVQKQLKMSSLMDLRQESVLHITDFILNDDSLVSGDVTHKSRNPFVENSMFCGTECHQSQYIRLPISSPYDNFLKAAGC